MNRNFPVSGLKELDRYLSALPAKMEKNAIRQGLTAAAAVIRDEAKLRVPKKTGKLARSIKSSSSRQNPDGTFSIKVQLEGRSSFLGHMLEYGIAPHFISAGDSRYNVQTLNRRAKRGGVEQRENGLTRIGGSEYDKRFHTKSGTEVRTLKINAHYVNGAVYHPGVRAHPFLLPAFDVKADEAISAFAKKINDFIDGVQSRTGYDARASTDEDS